MGTGTRGAEIVLEELKIDQRSQSRTPTARIELLYLLKLVRDVCIKMLGEASQILAAEWLHRLNENSLLVRERSGHNLEGDYSLVGTDWVDGGGERICVSAALRGGAPLVARDPTQLHSFLVVVWSVSTVISAMIQFIRRILLQRPLYISVCY